MSVTTIYGDEADGRIYGYNAATYATARSTASLADDPGLTIGQLAGFYCFESLIAFDGSSIPDGDDITSSILSMWLEDDSSLTDFTITAALKDWGTTVTIDDWVAGASLSGLTTVATLSTNGIGAIGAYKTFADVAMAANTSKTGRTMLLLYSSRHSAGNQPTGNEYVGLSHADIAGTTQDPKLVVTHTASASNKLTWWLNA